MPIGCCGRPVSLAGLLAEADFYPAQTPQGRSARARLAYTIAAGKASQIGNRPAYDRAMKGLGELGGLGIFTSSDPVLTQRASTAVTAAVRTASTGPTLSQTVSQIGVVANLLATFANAVTAIAGLAGGDANAITAANMIIGWIRAIVNGSTPTVPTLDANTLNGFTQFCARGAPIKSVVDLAFVALIGGLQTAGAASRDAGLTSAANTLQQVQTRIDGMFDGICAAVGAQAGPTTQTCPDGTSIPIGSTCATDAGCRANDPNTIARGAGCACANGLLDPARPYMGCRPVAGTPPSTPTQTTTPAVGTESGAGGCTRPGTFNRTAPGGIPNAAGVPIPGTAGSKNCGPCYAPWVYVPGVVNPATGMWTTPPRCAAPAGASASTSSKLPLVAAAAAAWFFLK